MSLLYSLVCKAKRSIQIALKTMIYRQVGMFRKQDFSRDLVLLSQLLWFSLVSVSSPCELISCTHFALPPPIFFISVDLHCHLWVILCLHSIRWPNLLASQNQILRRGLSLTFLSEAHLKKGSSHFLKWGSSDKRSVDMTVDFTALEVWLIPGFNQAQKEHYHGDKILLL